MIRKLYVISRDGKSINDFLDLHGLTKSDIIIVKNVKDLDSAKQNDRYVIIPPLPIAYHWSIRIRLNDLKMKNCTKQFNQQQIKSE